MRKNISHLAGLTANVKATINQVSNAAVLNNVCVEYLGKKEHLTPQMTTLRKLPPEERPAASAIINEAKEQIRWALNVHEAELESTALNACLAAEMIGVSLPGHRIENDGLHPVTRTINHVENFLDEPGFTMTVRPEAKDGYHNSNTLNIPGHHPMRADHDTFWFNATRLLYTQTSDVQIHTTKVQQPPTRIIAPSRIYRNDYDQTHTLMFHRMEGLTINTDVSFTSLKGALYDSLRNLFEEGLRIRFRPSYFPFTEPSAEVNVMGKNGKWLEVLGCRTVYSNMLRNVSIDPEIYSGSASRIGMERLTMLRYGVADLRSFFENDLRFLKQFK